MSVVVETGEEVARAFAARDHGSGIVVEDPATEALLAEVALATAADVDAAVGAARSAFADGRWAALDPVEQEAVLRRLAGLVPEHGEELAWLEVLDMSALRLAELALEAGLPDGVLNVITGDGTTGAALAAHPGLDKVAFTGPGSDPASQMGPLVSAEQLARVASYAGSSRVIEGPGHFIRPTVLAGVTPADAVWREEVFGPVVTVTPFDTVEEAVALANDTRYGLAAGVWSGDAGRALRAARGIRAGTVWINAYGSIRPEVPFGGVGESGLGRELGAHGLAAYTEPKSLFVAL